MNNRNSRRLVYESLEFSGPTVVPRQMWALPWAHIHYGDQLNKIIKDYPDDIITANPAAPKSAVEKGDMFALGEAVDPWGCVFTNRQPGIIGEVKSSLVEDEDWEDFKKVHIPTEQLEFSIEEVNSICAASDKFVLAGACPRPFEQMQFIRGTEELMVDIALENPGFQAALGKMHNFYCDLLERWAKTDVDALSMMDDWGTQNSLLISPNTWRKLFKPLYKEYIDIAHSNNKKMFMHSDGYILDIYPDLIEIGLDAVNSQIFCMSFDDLTKFAGKITFWGEIDRQHILPRGSVEDVRSAVEQVYQALWRKGGCIAQCEFGIGATPANVRAVFEAWDKISTN